MRRQLIADPELIKKGTDELLRLYSPTLAWPAPCPATRSSMAAAVCRRSGHPDVGGPTETRRCSRIPTRLIWPGRMPRSTWHLVSACIAASARTMPR
ncbi:putative cytochrome P450 [Mycobacterium xenopi 4042]|uniref:Putative cytochrome P450 n=1 Tax=Mycobacterium xenopi 4042 TaxID=1299334 RepID=X8BM40_MYCXE|nr:putative cytochrome P450 [Mycobacterium xenopi 4042]